MTFRLATIDASFFDTARHRSTHTQQLPVSAAAAFRCLEDGHAWTVWLGLSSCRWTSELGPGATRVVRTGPIRMHEEFFVWEPGAEMSFRFSRSTLPLRAAGERWRLTDHGDGTSEIAWTYAAEGLVAPIFIRQLDGMARKRLPQLAAYLASPAT